MCTDSFSCEPSLVCLFRHSCKPKKNHRTYPAVLQLARRCIVPILLEEILIFAINSFGRSSGNFRFHFYLTVPVKMASAAVARTTCPSWREIENYPSEPDILYKFGHVKRGLDRYGIVSSALRQSARRKPDKRGNGVAAANAIRGIFETLFAFSTDQRRELNRFIYGFV